MSLELLRLFSCCHETVVLALRHRITFPGNVYLTKVIRRQMLGSRGVGSAFARHLGRRGESRGGSENQRATAR